MPRHKPCNAPATLPLPHAPSLGGDLCRCLHKGSLQALKAVVVLSAHAVPSKTVHSLLCRVSRSALPEGQSSALMKAGRFLREGQKVPP